MIAVSLNPCSSSVRRIAPTVHHVARRNDVRARLRMRRGLARQHLERRIIVDVAIPNDAAMAVVSVFAQANVGDDDEVRQLTFERAYRLLNRRLVVPRFGADRVLSIRNSE
jgi:hypothetical protein